MEQYVILARSVTYAQRMQKLLGQAGIRCQISRAPRDLTDLVCAYILRLDEKNVAQALTILRLEGFDPLRLFLSSQGRYREVQLT